MMNNTTATEIANLRTAAAQAGDHMMAAICDLALDQDSTEAHLACLTDGERAELAAMDRAAARAACARAL